MNFFVHLYFLPFMFCCYPLFIVKISSVLLARIVIIPKIVCLTEQIPFIASILSSLLLHYYYYYNISANLFYSFLQVVSTHGKNWGSLSLSVQMQKNDGKCLNQTNPFLVMHVTQTIPSLLLLYLHLLFSNSVNKSKLV